MEESTDFLIIGASVAGSVLAAQFAPHGKVIFVDKYVPGTWMNCGGGLPEKVFKSFDIDIPFVPIKKAVMNIHGKNWEFPCNYVVVDRSELDKALLQKACRSGAEFKKMNYIGCDSENQIASLKDGSRITQIKYRKLVLAHGFHPMVEPFSRGKRNLSYGAAIVEIVDGDSPHPDQFYFHINSNGPPGYSWIFPMPSGRMNIGSGGFNTGSLFFKQLSSFKSVENVTGHVQKKGGGVLPLRPAGKIQQGNLYLFGDTAGMVNALNGEGLLHIAKFAPRFVRGVVQEKNLNLVWKTSPTFWYLTAVSSWLRFMNMAGAVLKLPMYPFSCRMVAFIRRILGKMIGGSS